MPPSFLIMGKRKKNTLKVVNKVALGDIFTPTSSANSDNKIWAWGNDNLFPQRIELLARSNSIHRGIIKSKADYITGRGFAYDDSNAALNRIVKRANGMHSLFEVMQRVIYDKVMTGNAFLEVAVAYDQLLFFHHDSTQCRVTKDGKYIVLSKDWRNHIDSHDVTLPIYPIFERDSDNVARSIIHLKDYEPMFEHYGVPDYVAGLGAARIGYKTANWNEQRLDNSFQLSGVMEVVSPEANEEELSKLARDIEGKFAGKPGQVMFAVSNDAGSASFTPIQANNEGDWTQLHNISKNDLVTAHSWFISLAGLEYSTGISSNRMLNEYSVALTTVILPEQERILEVLCGVMAKMGIDGSSLEFVNKAPILEKPVYMRVWEARKVDGLDYDETDPAQQLFLANISRVGGKQHE